MALPQYVRRTPAAQTVLLDVLPLTDGELAPNSRGNQEVSGRGQAEKPAAVRAPQR